MRFAGVLTALLLSAGPALGQAGLPKSNDALALGLADALSLPEADRWYLRYVWVMDGDTEAAQMLSYAMNRISRASPVKRPKAIGRGPLLAVRFDLRHYARTEADLTEIARAWEELRFDPALNYLLTRDTVKFAQKTAIGPEPKFLVHWRADGKMHRGEYSLKDAGDYAVLRAVPEDVDAELLWRLQVATYSAAPMVTAPYFVARSQTSIRDAGLFGDLYATLYGGLYYDFLGVPSGTKNGTDLDRLLEKLGVGNLNQKVDFRQVFNDIGSDKRIAIFRSDVAGKRPRRVYFLPILGGDVFETRGFLSFTDDFKRANIDIGVHPVMNLLGKDADAHEGLWTMNNGFIGSGLWNGPGARQDKAPDDVAHDRTVTGASSAELAAGLNCAACHEAYFAHDGWQPVVNSVQKLARGGALRPRILDDLGARSQFDAIQRIEELYRGDPEKLLSKARDDYARAVLTATGPWKRSKRGDQADVVQLASLKMVEMSRGHLNGPVTARLALRELGLDVPEKDSRGVFDALTPPVGLVAGFAPEDPRVAAIKAGDEIGRVEWDLVRSPVAGRVMRTLKTNPKLLEAR